MSKPIRILDLRDSTWVDGPGRTILDTASAIDRDRCELVVVAFSGGGENDYIAEARRRGLCVEVVRETGAFDRRVIGQILGLVDRYSIDLLHTHDFRSNMMGLYCASRSGIPVVATCHGWIANNLKGKVYRAIDKRQLRLCARVIAVSRALKDQLVAGGVSSAKVDVVPNALVVENFEPSSRNRGLRAELGLEESVTVISNIGRLSPEKGQTLFIQAASEILNSHDDVCFVVVGTGEDEGHLRELVAEKGIERHVHFVGFRTNMNVVYDSSDLVVQSSFTEGMPNVMLEALLMKTPVVATDVGGTGEVVEDGVTGCLVDPNSVQQLARGISKFLLNPDRLREMAVRGRSRVISQFNHDARVERMTGIYEELHGVEKP